MCEVCVCVCARVRVCVCVFSVAFDCLCSGVQHLGRAHQDHLQRVQEELKAADSSSWRERLLVVGLLAGCAASQLGTFGWVLLRCFIFNLGSRGAMLLAPVGPTEGGT